MCTSGHHKEEATPGTFEHLLGRVRALVEGPYERDEKLHRICTLLAANVLHYHWVGFYLVGQPEKKELVLGPFVGDPTEHVRIPFGRGICGQAAERREILMVQDISRESNYVACSPSVKAEIIVPILRNGALLGLLDIDSHLRTPFSVEDQAFLEQVCELLTVLF
jgi:L-methionine (R)-S-oxide reductase